LQLGSTRCRLDRILSAPQNAKSCEPEGPQDLTARL
jgi:hypothetical protein